MIEFLAILLIVYLSLRVLGRYLFPWLLKRYLKKVEKRFMEANPDFKPKPPRNEGDVHVDYVPKKKKNSSDEGEYVDYEEIK